MSVDNSPQRTDEQPDFDEQESRRRFHERLSDWSDEPMKINRSGKLLDPVIRRWRRVIPWARPKP